MAPSIGSSAVRLEPEAGRFVLATDGGEASAFFQPAADGALVMTHTEVPEAERGQGVGSVLAEGLFRIARERDLRLILRCPFLVAWFKGHPDFADVVEQR